MLPVNTTLMAQLAVKFSRVTGGDYHAYLISTPENRDPRFLIKPTCQIDAIAREYKEEQADRGVEVVIKPLPDEAVQDIYAQCLDELDVMMRSLRLNTQ